MTRDEFLERAQTWWLLEVCNHWASVHLVPHPTTKGFPWKRVEDVPNATFEAAFGVYIEVSGHSSPLTQADTKPTRRK